jgi:peptidyl-dipeptidase A
VLFVEILIDPKETMPTEQEAQLFIDYFVAEARSIWTALARARWHLATTGEQQYKREQVKLRLQEHQLYEDANDWDRVQGFYAQRGSFNPLLSRQVEILHRYFRNNQSTVEENEAIARLEADIQEIFSNHRAEVNGRRLSNNEIAEILKDSDNEETRRQAWAGSKNVGALVADQIRELAHRRNAIARRLGFRDFYAFALERQEIDEDTLFSLFQKLAEVTEEPFSRFKAEIDSTLSRRLEIPAQPLAPWHYADPFFQEIPPSYAVDLDSFFADVDVAELSRKAYAGMGLPVSDILARSDLYEREGKHQHAFCIRIDREGDTRILCNLRPNSRWMTTQMHELGHAIYNKHLPLDLPYLLRTPAHTNSTEAIAMLMGRLPRNPCWLRDVVGREPDEVEAATSELVRELAATQLVFVRWVLVMMHFERALYANPDRPDLNEFWWQLVESYQQLTPPPGRDEPDWAAKEHLGLAPVYYHNYVLGELTTSQLERWIQREAGNLVNNPAAGQLLVERFFAHGARYTWDELIEVATGEPLQPDYFVEQFV